MRTSAELSIYSRGEIRRRLVGPQMCPIHHYCHRLSLLHSLLPNCPSGGHSHSILVARSVCCNPLATPSLASHLF